LQMDQVVADVLTGCGGVINRHFSALYILGQR